MSSKYPVPRSPQKWPLRLYETRNKLTQGSYPPLPGMASGILAFNMLAVDINYYSLQLMVLWIGLSSQDHCQLSNAGGPGVASRRILERMDGVWKLWGWHDQEFG